MSAAARRAREVARTRKDILEAAARAFVRSGFKAATMQDIAKEAGYTAASLYSYFTSKEEIFAELHQMLLAEVSEVFARPIPDGLTFRQKLDLVLRREIELAEQRFETFAMLLFDANQIGTACRAAGFHRRVELFTEFVEKHATAEDLGGHDPETVALAIVGMGHGFFLDWLRAPEAHKLGERLPQVLDLLFFGLRGQARTNASEPNA